MVNKYIKKFPVPLVARNVIRYFFMLTYKWLNIVVL